MTDVIIRFVSHRGIFNWLCQFAQDGFWATHCELVLDDGRRLSSWFHNTWFGKGAVRIEPADYDAGTIIREEFVTVKLTPEQSEKFHEFLNAQMGKRYDWRAIVAFVYAFRHGRIWQEDDAWFCDELFCGAFATCGKFPQKMAVEYSRLTVRDLSLIISSMVGGDG